MRFPLADDWLTEVVLDLSPAEAVPAYPLAQAWSWMVARARAMVKAVSAQPLPWEDGFAEALPRTWVRRLDLDPAPGLRRLYVILVVQHRLPCLTRQVIRDRQLHGLGIQEIAKSRGVSTDEVGERILAGAEALSDALDHLAEEDS